MNFFNNNISIDEYIKIKNYAYKSVEFFKKLSNTEKYFFLKNFNLNNKDAFAIFITTLFLPNDIEFIQLLKKNINTIELAQKFNIPFSLVISKKIELTEINLTFFIETGLIKKELALQKPITLNYLADNSKQSAQEKIYFEKILTIIKKI